MGAGDGTGVAAESEGDLHDLQGKSRTPFNQKRLSGGRSLIPEYEQRARAERTKIAKLRVLRLAREAALATEKRTPQKSSSTLRGGTRCEE
jgi:hypothetical protein